MEPGVIVATVSLLVSVAVFVRGEVRAHRTDGRAERAEQRAERAEVSAESLRVAQLWGELVAQIQPFIAVLLPDPNLGDRFLSLRRAAVELVDNVDPADWPALSEWLGAEHQLGALLGHAVLESGGPTGVAAPDAVMSAHEPLHDWAYAYMNNVRRLRRIGPGDEAHGALPRLVDRARESAARTCQAHGWPVPGPPDRIRPLDDEAP